MVDADRDFALAAIHENICTLRSAAFQFYRRRNFAIAAHLAIVCSEECAKCLLVFCREHLSEGAFKSRYRHVPKYRVLGVPWFIAGALSVVNLLVQAMRAGILGGTRKEHDVVIDDLFDFVGTGNPVRVAETVLKSLEKSSDEEHERSLRADIEKREKHRQAIYVDLDENCKITGRPTDIGREIAAKYLRDTTLGLATVNFLLSEKPDIDEYVRSLPRPVRKETKREVMEFTDKFREKAALKAEVPNIAISK